MGKSYTHSWTPEKLALESRQNVETIRKNAIRLGAKELIEMCDGDLRSRAPAKVKRVGKTHTKLSDSDVVTGYHFVCERDRGVTLIDDDRFWTGSWVVAEENVKKSLKYGAYLALHESKSETSYRQGKILDYRRSLRDMLADKEAGPEAKIEEGIEFLVCQSNKPYSWVPGGTGEKSYLWTQISTSPEPSIVEVTQP